MASKMLKITLVISSLMIIFGVLFSFEVQATTTELHIDEATIIKGYTVSHQNGDFLFAVTPNQVDQMVTVELKGIEQRDRPIPEDKTVISGYFQHDMLGDHSNPIIVSKPSYVAIRYNSDNDRPKYLYVWDRNKNAWSQMPSSIDSSGHYVRGLTHLPFGQVVILEDKAEVESYEGIASWYDAQEDHGAACLLYPMDTQLLVTALDSGKTTEVKVVDRGPFVSGWIIDLDGEAFADLAPLGTGLINVRIEPITEAANETSAELNISAPAAVVINSATGVVLWEKNSQAVRSIASLTKIMTAVIFLESGTSLDKIVTYQAEDEAEGSRLRVSPGEQLTARDLFFSMFVGSANNATNALARSTGLSREDFVARMNAKAQQWGLSKTTLTDPTGLDPGNQSTAGEYAILSRRALGSLLMLQGTTTRQYQFVTRNTQQPHTLRNTNKLLSSHLYITGGKTGYIDEAGYCLMTRAKDQLGHEVIAVVLGAGDSATRFNETQRLLEWGLNQLAN